MRLYGMLAPDSPAIDAADLADSPAEDILGRIRSNPDIGAAEFIPTLKLTGQAGDQIIYLNWRVDKSLPPRTTWQISYNGPPGDEPSPIANIPNITRTYALNGMANYIVYEVTLKAMLDNAAIMTDTINVMPTDRSIYLPAVLRQLVGS